jgi:hypothetical protein
MRNPQQLTTLQAYTACYGDSLTFCSCRMADHRLRRIWNSFKGRHNVLVDVPPRHLSWRGDTEEDTEILLIAPAENRTAPFLNTSQYFCRFSPCHSSAVTHSPRFLVPLEYSCFKISCTSLAYPHYGFRPTLDIARCLKLVMNLLCSHWSVQFRVYSVE